MCKSIGIGYIVRCQSNDSIGPDAVAAALRLPVTAEPSLDDIFEADRLARAYTRERFSDR